MNQQVKWVFISSTHADLVDHRTAVVEAIEDNFETLRVIPPKGRFTAEDAHTVDACLRRVEQCDLYVGILAFRYGSIPEGRNPNRLSFTDLEYRHAKSLGKPRLLFLWDEKAPHGPPRYLVDRDTARIDTLRAEFEASRLAQSFVDVQDLAQRVVSAVRNWWRENDSAHSWSDTLSHREGEFIFGREREIEQVLERLDNGPGIVVLSGAPGVGRFEVARAAYERSAARRTGGAARSSPVYKPVVPIDVFSRPEDQVARDLVAAITGRDSTSDPRILCRQLLARDPYWVTLRYVSDAAAVQFLLQGVGRSRLILTTSDPSLALKIGLTDQHVEISPPDRSVALELLAANAGGRVRLGSDERMIDLVLDQVGCMPHSLMVIGRLLSLYPDRTVASVASELVRERSVAIPGHSGLDTRSPIRLVLKAFSPDHQDMLAALFACHAFSFSDETAVACCDWRPLHDPAPPHATDLSIRLQSRLSPTVAQQERARRHLSHCEQERRNRGRLLRELHSAGILRREGTGAAARYRFSALVADVLGELSGTRSTAQRAAAAHTDYFCTMLATGGARLDDHDIRLAGAIDDLRAIAARISVAPEAPDWRVPLALEQAFEQFGRQDDARRLCEHMVAHAHAAGDVEAEFEFRLKLAKYLRHGRQYSHVATQHRHARFLLRRVSDPILRKRLRGMVSTSIAIERVKSAWARRGEGPPAGRLRRAASLCELATGLAREIGSEPALRFAQTQQARVCAWLGDVEQAVNLFRTVEASATRDADWESLAVVLTEFARLAENASARVEPLLRAVQAARNTRSPRTIARSLDALARAYRDAGAHAEALDALLEMEHLEQHADSLERAAERTLRIATTMKMLGNGPEALGRFRQAHSLALQTSDFGLQKRTHTALQRALGGDADQHRRISQELIGDLVAIESDVVQESAMMRLALVSMSTGALLHADDERELEERFKRHGATGARIGSLALVAHRHALAGRYEEAEAEWSRCFVLIESSFDRDLLWQLLLGRAYGLHHLGRGESAVRHAVDALSTYATVVQNGRPAGMPSPFPTVRAILAGSAKLEVDRQRASDVLSTLAAAVRANVHVIAHWDDLLADISRTLLALGRASEGRRVLGDGEWSTHSALDRTSLRRLHLQRAHCGAAVHRYEEALAACDEVVATGSEDALTVQALRLASFVALRADDAQRADACVQQALAILRRTTHLPATLACAVDLQAAVVKMHLGRMGVAAAELERLRDLPGLPDRLRAAALELLADCYRSTQQGDAKQPLQGALELARRLGDGRLVQRIALRLGALLTRDQAFDSAHALWLEAGFQGVPEDPSVAVRRATMLLNIPGKASEALSILEPVRAIAEMSGNAEHEFNVLHLMGRARSYLGDWHAAHQLHLEALAAADRSGRPRKLAVGHEALASVLDKLADADGSTELRLRAARHHRDSISAARLVRDIEAEAKALRGLIQNQCATLLQESPKLLWKTEQTSAERSVKELVPLLLDALGHCTLDQRERDNLAATARLLRKAKLDSQATEVERLWRTGPQPVLAVPPSAPTLIAGFVKGLVRRDGKHYAFVQPDDSTDDLYLPIGRMPIELREALVNGARVVVTSVSAGLKGRRTVEQCELETDDSDA